MIAIQSLERAKPFQTDAGCAVHENSCKQIHFIVVQISLKYSWLSLIPGEADPIEFDGLRAWLINQSSSLIEGTVICTVYTAMYALWL